MKTFNILTLAALVVSGMPLLAQEVQPRQRDDAKKGDSWTKMLKDRSERGKLQDAFQLIRGDSGKWRDEPALQHAPPIGQKPMKTSLDDWADQLLEKKDFRAAAGDDNWLIFRTRQLDDNDRLWVERIERNGNQFTIVLSEAIWQGRYMKTFTYYGVFGVNLGQLEPGKYEAKWIVQPLVFKQFEGDGRPMDNWPKDERPAEKKPVELRVAFSVAPQTPPDDKQSQSGLPSREVLALDATPTGSASADE